jgi:hypothetical protein
MAQTRPEIASRGSAELQGISMTNKKYKCLHKITNERKGMTIKSNVQGFFLIIFYHSRTLHFLCHVFFFTRREQILGDTKVCSLCGMSPSLVSRTSTRFLLCDNAK